MWRLFINRWAALGCLFLIVMALIANAVFPFIDAHNRKTYSHIVTANDGRVLRAFADADGVWRQKISLDQVSDNYLQALLAYEDRWFYFHPGVNPVAVVRAAWQNLRCGCVISGGSTISMQVARIFHPHSRSIGGKLYQLLRTLQLEFTFSKKEILELYINHAPFGGVVEGVQAASATYLEKNANDLTDAEAALLVVLPQSPSRLRPDRHPEAAMAARNKVIARLVVLREWLPERAHIARLEHVHSQFHAKPRHAPLLARRLRQQQPQQQTIHSSIDYDLQVSLESYLKDHVQSLPQNNSLAAMVVENHSGRVLAYIGSADFTDTSRFGHVDMITGIRSPGSTLKPFIYGLAIDQGYIHSHSLLLNTPRIYDDYRPTNFNQKFSGPVNASAALQASLNLPAVQLLEQLTPAYFHYYLKNLGVDMRYAGEPSLAIALGGVGVNLWQLVTLYHGLANGGQVVELSLQPASQGNTEHGARQGSYLLSPGSAWVVYHMLSSAQRPDRLNTSMLYGHDNNLAWKTGTSYGSRDAWALGFNNNYTLGVWVGRPDGTANPGHLGAQTALPILFNMANNLRRDTAKIAQPDTVQQIDICWPLGLAKSHTHAEHCHKSWSAFIVDGKIPPTLQPSNNDNLGLNPLPFWVNTDTGLRVDKSCQAPRSYRQSIAWWPRVSEPWIPKRWRLSEQLPVADSRCDHPVAALPHQLAIATPETDSIFQLLDDSPITVNLQAVGGQGDIHWYADGAFIGTSSSGGYVPYQLQKPGYSQLIAVDTLGNIDRSEIFVRAPMQ